MTELNDDDQPDPPAPAMNGQLIICQIALGLLRNDETLSFEDQAKARAYEFFLSETELTFEDFADPKYHHLARLIAIGMRRYRSSDYVMDKVEADSMRVHLRSWTGLHIPYEYWDEPNN